MTIEDIRNFVPLSERLATAGQPSEHQVQELARAGFEVVVNLGLLDPRYCLADEAGLVGSLGMAYHHIPVDFKAPRFDDLEKFFAVMDGSSDKKVFVHCAANYRVSSFVALYGQAKLGWSASQADAHIRRVWEPDDMWRGFIEECRRDFASQAPRGGFDMVKGLATVIYHVTDLNRAKGWYAAAFEQQPYFDEPFYVGFNIAGYELGLDPNQTVTSAGRGGGVAYWRVAEIAGAVQHFVAAGATAVAPVQDVGGGIKVATVADPFGNLIGLIENPHFKLP